MKKLIAAVLSAALCLSLVSCGSSEIEGAGFHSPESALFAYMQGLQSNNMPVVLSTFAIETFLENYDLEEHMEHENCYSRKSIPYLVEDDYTHELNLITRQHEIAQDLTNLYYTFSLENYEGNSIVFSKENGYDDADEFLDTLMMEDWSPVLYSMQFEPSPTYCMGFEYLSLTEEQLEDIDERLDDMCEYYGCDEIVPMIGYANIQGTYYYFCMDIACYDGKWYNLKAAGIMNEYATGNPASGGIFTW